MTVRKRGKHWHYDFRLNSVRHRGAIPEAVTQRQAERAEIAIKAQCFDAKYGVCKSIRFREFSKSYLEWAKANKRSYKTDEFLIKVCIEFFGNYSLNDVSVFLVERFKQERMKAPTAWGTIRKPASVNREIDLLSRIFGLARENGYIKDNPVSLVRKLRQNNQRSRYLLLDEEEKLFKDLPEWLRPIVTIALNTGMRRSEITNLCWSDIDLQRNIIHVTDSKNGDRREIPANEDVKPVLEKLFQERTSERVLESITPNKISIAFGKVVDNARIDDFHFHDLRHTAATRMLEQGIDVLTIAYILGHRTLQMTKRYAHVRSIKAREALESLRGWKEKNGHKMVTIENEQIEKATT